MDHFLRIASSPVSFHDLTKRFDSQEKLVEKKLIACSVSSNHNTRFRVKIVLKFSLQFPLRS